MQTEPKKIRRLQLLLHDNCRSDVAREEAKHAVEETGMNLSGEGAATLSVRIPDADFKNVFPGPARRDGALTIPKLLEPYVSSITEAPEHLSFEPTGDEK